MTYSDVDADVDVDVDVDLVFLIISVFKMGLPRHTIHVLGVVL